MRFSASYPEQPYVPFWGTPDANTNFCEEDYIISPFVAEFINTLTNITYIICAIDGLRKAHLHNRAGLMPFVGLMFVGICSSAFHMTLREYPQLSDDISMALPTTFVFCRILAFGIQNTRSAMRIKVTTLTVLVIIYTIHLLTNGQTLHSLTFATMVAFIGIRTRHIISAPASKANHEMNKRLARRFRMGGALFVLGFIMWAIDQRACVYLTKAKRALGMPWAFILELHGWWHITTAIGAYQFIRLVEILTGRAGKHGEKDS